MELFGFFPIVKNILKTLINKRMEQDFLTNFITKIQQEQEQKDAEEKRKNHFRTIGKKGGLAKKNLLFFLKQFLQNSLKKNLKFSEQKQKN